MKLQINQSVTGWDLAALLHGEEGLFICQNRGQVFATVAKAGHSIAFGPTPIGPRVEVLPAQSLGPDPWIITKVSNSSNLEDFEAAAGTRQFPAMRG